MDVSNLNRGRLRYFEQVTYTKHPERTVDWRSQAEEILSNVRSLDEFKDICENKTYDELRKALERDDDAIPSSLQKAEDRLRKRLKKEACKAEALKAKAAQAKTST